MNESSHSRKTVAQHCTVARDGGITCSNCGSGVRIYGTNSSLSVLRSKSRCLDCCLKLMDLDLRLVVLFLYVIQLGVVRKRGVFESVQLKVIGGPGLKSVAWM